MMFTTVEHAFQAAKTLDIEKRMEIAALPTPGKAKRAGRELEIRKDWEDTVEEIVQERGNGKILPSL